MKHNSLSSSPIIPHPGAGKGKGTDDPALLVEKQTQKDVEDALQAVPADSPRSSSTSPKRPASITSTPPAVPARSFVAAVNDTVDQKESKEIASIDVPAVKPKPSVLPARLPLSYAAVAGGRGLPTLSAASSVSEASSVTEGTSVPEASSVPERTSVPKGTSVPQGSLSASPAVLPSLKSQNGAPPKKDRRKRSQTAAATDHGEGSAAPQPLPAATQTDGLVQEEKEEAVERDPAVEETEENEEVVDGEGEEEEEEDYDDAENDEDDADDDEETGNVNCIGFCHENLTLIAVLVALFAFTFLFLKGRGSY